MAFGLLVLDSRKRDSHASIRETQKKPSDLVHGRRRGGGARWPATITLAADPPKIDSGDTTWILVTSALVLSMTAPGLAHGKNVPMQSFILMAVISRWARCPLDGECRSAARRGGSVRRSSELYKRGDLGVREAPSPFKVEARP